MQEGDTMLETSVGRMSDGRWCWRARGAGVEEFCRTIELQWGDGNMEAISDAIDDDGWFHAGPYRSKRAATRACEEFERDFMEARYPDCEITDAPDPQSLN
jgi:hypothetical protein